MTVRERPEPLAPSSLDEAFAAMLEARLAASERRARRREIAGQIGNGLFYAAFLLAFGVLAFMLGDRAPAVTVRDAEVMTPTVRPGEALRVRYLLTRHRSCRTETTWVIVDGDGERRLYGPTVAASGGRPGEDEYVRSWPVPFGAAPGSARLRVTLSWECPRNLLHPLIPITETLPDIQFTIARP